MDIERISAIINNEDYTDEAKKKFIFDILSEDESIIFNFLKILSSERKINAKIISEYNVELSISLATLEDKGLGTKNAMIELDFMTGRIRTFFKKWRHKVTPNLKFKGLD